MSYPKLIDNIRINLGDVLKQILPKHKCLSIATGYWDLPGTAEIIECLKKYDSIRLLIGQEPISFRYQQELHLNFDNVDALFPNKDFKVDLEQNGKLEEVNKLKSTVEALVDLIKNKKLEVKIYKRTTLHAKAYIFGNFDSEESIGILGSSNFTKAGLYTNTELDSLEEDFRIVNFRPSIPDQENGYLSWFESLWNDDEAVEWTGEFKNIIQNSPVGNLCYGPYDSYIKTLMEIYPDELLPPKELEKDTKDILYSFQNRNAGILINKLNKNGVAMLSDSVGLGKTITAGAVIKHYLEKTNQKANILIIAPAALKQQWKDDLANILGVDCLTGDYQIVSQQDTNAINKIYEEYDKEWRIRKNIDLFVIDEAHNLRSKSGIRHDAILNLLQQHKNADVLLLTATPINNSLLDIANIIQLASKGKLNSVNVSYTRPDDKGVTEHIDFFEALKRIQTEIKKAEKAGEDIQKLLEKVKPTIHEGLMHYLVRSTRQGVEAEGGIIDKKTGKKTSFPKSNVTSINYKYNSLITDFVYDNIGKHIYDVFEGIDPRLLNLQLMAEFTQETCHPLDFLNEGLRSPNLLKERFKIDDSIWVKEPLYLSSVVKNLVPNILQIIFTFGFTPYRPAIYKYKYYKKKISDIDALKDVPLNERIQFSAHNVLQVTWLKRMESSGAALLVSVNNYLARLNLFKKYLNKGYIVNLTDAALLERDYGDGEDIESAFEDYKKYLEEKEKLIEESKNPEELKKAGVERVDADPKVYNVAQIMVDLAREEKLINLLLQLLNEVIKPINDTKAQHLVDEIKNTISQNIYGKKVIVFSFFADTINYLKDNANIIFKQLDPSFDKHSGFISGQNSNVEEIVRLFSPKSKHYQLKPSEEEINFLFSTDVLSEGQNLQDAGYLINYDLHWNPVRMIQRNGRINRLGSPYNEVKVSNMRPIDELDLYLNLVNRLERKISTIRNTVGLDQGVLSVNDVNPIEFIERYYTKGELPDEEGDLLASSNKHILNLRKFLGDNPVGTDNFNFVKEMPIGKWNYLPESSTLNDLGLSLVKINGITSVSKQKFSNLFFVKISSGDYGYMATYVDSTTALNLIETDPTDNERKIDNITMDRVNARNRVIGEAKRQAENPSIGYTLKPSEQKALNILLPYLIGNNSPKLDYQGIIQNGVTTIDIQQKFGKVFRTINKESSQKGSISASTINEFLDIFKKIMENESESREILDSEVILTYVKQ